MLQTISWKEYFTLMSLGLGLYYSRWLARYFPGLKFLRMEKAEQGTKEPQSLANHPVEHAQPAQEQTQPVQEHANPVQGQVRELLS